MSTWFRGRWVMYTMIQNFVRMTDIIAIAIYMLTFNKFN